MAHTIPHRVSTITHLLSQTEEDDREKSFFMIYAPVLALCLFLVTSLSGVLSFFLKA